LWTAVHARKKRKRDKKEANSSAQRGELKKDVITASPASEEEGPYI